MTDPVETAWNEAREPLKAFIQCPECGSDAATLVVDADHPFGEERRVAIRATCSDCEHKTPFLPIAQSEKALFERINEALYND